MAAGLRLPCPGPVMDFSPFSIFSNTPLCNNFKQACKTRCPTDLQYLCCKALINKNISIFVMCKALSLHISLDAVMYHKITVRFFVRYVNG